MLRFRTLGTIDLRGDDGRRIESVLLHSKRLSLLAYLCASYPPRLHRRDTLIALLWPDLDGAHARGALRQELTRLRRALGPGVLLGEGSEAVSVDAQRLWCDVQAFEAALHSGQHSAALELWGGEFLPGVHVDGGEFERWLDEVRDSLGRRAVAAARRLLEDAEKRGDFAVAVGWARRLMELAPYDETGWQRLISLLDGSGDRAGALTAYEALTARLRDELEVEPSPETQELVQRIRARAQAFATVPETLLETTTPASLPGAQVATASAPAPTLRSAASRRRRWQLAGGLLGVTAALLAVQPAIRRMEQRSPPVIALLPVENQTGDPAFGAVADRLTQRLAHGLAQLGFINLALGADTANATAVVATSISRSGTLAEVRTRLMRSGQGGLVIEIPEPFLLGPDAADASFDTLVARVQASVAANYNPQTTVPPDRVPYETPLWEAYLAHLRGTELFGQFRFAEAAEQMLEAYEIDHSFVNAALFAAIALVYLGQPATADSLVSAVVAEADALPEWQRLWCEWLLADLHGRRARAYRAMTEAHRLSPHPSARMVLSQEALNMNRPREAARLLEGLVTLSEGRGWWRNWTKLWEVRGGALHALEQYQREVAAVLPGRERFPESFDVIRAEIRARAGAGQPAEVLRLAYEALTFPPAPSAEVPPAVTTPADIAWTAAQELDYHGQPGAAATARRLALGWLRQRTAPTRAEQMLRARLLLETGDPSGAQRILNTLAPFEDLPSLGLAGLVAAARGDTTLALRVIATLEATSSPYLNGRHLLLAAGVRTALDQPHAAMETLRRARAAGLPFGVELHALPMLRPLVGRPDFAIMLRPRG